MQLRASQRRPLLHGGRRSEPPDPCLRSWRSRTWPPAERPIMPPIGPSPGRRAPWPAVAEPGAVHHGLDPYCRGIGDSLHASGRRCLDSGVSLPCAFGLPHGPVVPSAAAICWMAVASAGLACHLPATTVAGRGLVWPDAGGCWPPVWLLGFVSVANLQRTRT